MNTIEAGIYVLVLIEIALLGAVAWHSDSPLMQTIYLLAIVALVWFSYKTYKLLRRG